jgi:hypothetical protein
MSCRSRMRRRRNDVGALHDGWGLDAEVVEGADHLALGYCGGGE